MDEQQTNNQELTACVGFSGMFKFSIQHDDGKVEETDWFDNVITDAGLNRMGTSRQIHALQVGTGSFPSPSTTSLKLQTFRARSIVGADGENRLTGGSGTELDPYWASLDFVATFAKGIASGTLTEIGVDFYTGSNSNIEPPSGNLFSHALIPGSLVVASDAILTVTYRIKSFLPRLDVISNLPMVGSPGTRTCTIRPASITGSNWMYASSTFGFNRAGVAFSTYDNVKYYTGGTGIGAITGIPSGTARATTSTTNATYVNNSLLRSSSSVWDTIASGGPVQVKAALFPTSLGPYQVQFDPPIDLNTKTQTLTLTMTIRWGRYPLS